MARLRGRCEVALSKADLDEAIRLWFDKLTLTTDFQLVSVSLHPTNKYVARAVIEPPEARKEVAVRLAAEQ